MGGRRFTPETPNSDAEVQGASEPMANNIIITLQAYLGSIYVAS